MAAGVGNSIFSPATAYGIGFGFLRFEIFLDFGVWNLEFSRAWTWDVEPKERSLTNAPPQASSSSIAATAL